MRERSSVIIVDDDKILLQMLQSGLSMDGYHCETASSAMSALELINRNSFDIMITDINMPEMNGLELTKKVKRLKPEMEIIIMTGLIDNFSYDTAIDAGASDFIKKPFSLKEVIAKIKHIKIQEELKRRSKELEEFYDIAVGRELRVKQLTEEIEQLKEELERYKI